MDIGAGSGQGSVVATFDARVVLKVDETGRYSFNVVQAPEVVEGCLAHSSAFRPAGLEGAVLRSVGAAESPLEWIAEDLAQTRDRVAPVIDALVDMGLVASRAYRGAFSGCAALGGRILHRLTPAGHAALASLQTQVDQPIKPEAKVVPPAATTLPIEPPVVPISVVASPAPSKEPEAPKAEAEAAQMKWTDFHDQVMGALLQIGDKQVATVRVVHKAMGLDVKANAASLLTKVNATLADLARTGRVVRDQVMVPGRYALRTAYAYALPGGARASDVISSVEPEPRVKPPAGAPCKEDVPLPKGAAVSPPAAPRPVPPNKAKPTLAPKPAPASIPVAAAPPRQVESRQPAKPAAPKSRMAEAAASILASRPMFSAPKLTPQQRIDRQVDPLAHLRDPTGEKVSWKVETGKGRPPPPTQGAPSRNDVLSAMARLEGNKGWFAADEIAAAISPGSAKAIAETLAAMHGAGLVWMRRDDDGPGAFSYSLKKQAGGVAQAAMQAVP